MSAIYQDGMWYSTSSCQVDVMPTPNETLVDLIVQYVGETTQNYKNGYFYKCVSDGESTPTYSWENVRVQEGGGGGGSDVTVTQIVDSGTKIAEIDVDGTTTDLFSPKEVVTIMKNDFAALTQEQKDNGTAYFVPDMFVENNITVVEGYYNESDGKFYEEDTYETEITGETGILYYSLDTDNKYKWDGEQFVLLVPVSGGGSSGTGGHIIVDKNETELSSRSKLQFAGDLETTDDSTNDKTIIKPYRLTSSDFDEIMSVAPSSISTNACFTPIGTIISVMGTHAPYNYLVCDGSVVNIADYPELAGYFESQFGESNHFGGDGETTFAVPDLRGEFLRGTGTNSHENQGSGANVGVHQDGTEHVNISAHSDKNVNWNNSSYSSSRLDVNKTDSNIGTDSNNIAWSGSGGNGTLSYSKTPYFTSRPTNTSVLYCIATKNIVFQAGMNFSTDEQVVGTWIDGKPIYQKTFTGLNINLSSGVWYNTNIFSLNNNPIGGFVYAGGNDNFIKYINIRSHEGYWKLLSDVNAGTFSILTIQYTKTTD